MPSRDRWPSRTAFIYAAVGSAVGLGNIWRFPYLAHEFGGGAFLIPFLIALFIAGIPLLILEFAIGQKIQKGAVDSFASVHKRLAGIGWWALFTGFIVVSYYVVIMSWSLVYTVSAAGSKWSNNPETFFFDNIIQLSSGIDQMGSIVPAVFIGLLVCWSFIYLSIRNGVKSVSKVIMITVPLPILLMIILVVRALTLDGAFSGIIAFLAPDFSALLDPRMWTAAFAQVFFSLSIAFGVMIAYASFNKKDDDVAMNAFSVGISDAVIAILAGFVVFGTLGFMAHEQGVGLDEVASSGVGLAFVTFPTALSMMPLANLFGILFFLTMLTLAIDSAFSLVEAFSTTIRDKTSMSRGSVAFVLCLSGFLVGVLFTFQGGLYLLDVVDHFVSNVTLLAIGILECIVIGWIYGADKLRIYVNKVSELQIGVWWNVSIKFIIPITLVVLLALQLRTEFLGNYGGYPDWAIAIGWAAVIIPMVVAFLLPQRSIKSG